MKRLLIIWGLALLIALPSGVAEELKILTVGNSFANNATAFLYEVAKSENRSFLIGRANLGGASLERHLQGIKAFESAPDSSKGRPYPSNFTPPREKKQYSLRELLAAERWNIVTIQQASHLSTQFSTYEPFAGELIAYIRQYAPQAEILIHQTWAYREDYPEFISGKLTPAQAHAQIHESYRQLAEKYHLRIIPVGDAFNAARRSERWRFTFPDPTFDYNAPKAGSIPNQKGSLNKGWEWKTSKDTGKEVFALDYKHANAAGKYLGTLIWFQTLTGSPVTSASYLPQGLDAESAEDLRQLAASLLKTPSPSPQP